MKKLLDILLEFGMGAFRIVVGILVISAGYDLLRNQGSFAFWSDDSHVKGLFIVGLGVFFIILGIFPRLFDSTE